MKKIINYVIVSVLFLASCSEQPDKHSFRQTESLKDAGFSKERLNRIDSFYESKIRQGVLPNAIAFVAKKGKIIYFKQFGWRNVEKKIPVQKDDIFRWASQSKAITSVGIMMLFEQGKLLLDDPISKYLPEFKDMKVVSKLKPEDTTFVLIPCKTPITIRHLLTHTSGIPYPDKKYYHHVTVPGICTDDISLDELVSDIAKLPLNHEPGTAFTYGYSTDIIGKIIEIISGEKLDVYLKKNIFEPLQMNDTYFYLPKEKESRLVTLYEQTKSGEKVIPSTSELWQNFPVSGARKMLSGGAGLVGTIEDYAKFMQMLLNKGWFNGKQLLSPRTVEMMSVNQTGNLVVSSTKNNFGLGLEIVTREGLQAVLGTIGSYKWGGMFGTEYIIDPENDMIMLIYMNTQPYPDKLEMMKKFRVLVYQAMIK